MSVAIATSGDGQLRYSAVLGDFCPLGLAAKIRCDAPHFLATGTVALPRCGFATVGGSSIGQIYFDFFGAGVFFGATAFVAATGTAFFTL